MGFITDCTGLTTGSTQGVFICPVCCRYPKRLLGLVACGLLAFRFSVVANLLGSIVCLGASGDIIYFQLSKSFTRFCAAVDIPEFGFASGLYCCVVSGLYCCVVVSSSSHVLLYQDNHSASLGKLYHNVYSAQTNLASTAFIAFWRYASYLFCSAYASNSDAQSVNGQFDNR
jgi:hypothetical protein